MTSPFCDDAFRMRRDDDPCKSSNFTFFSYRASSRPIFSSSIKSVWFWRLTASCWTASVLQLCHRYLSLCPEQEGYSLDGALIYRAGALRHQDLVYKSNLQFCLYHSSKERHEAVCSCHMQMQRWYHRRVRYQMMIRLRLGRRGVGPGPCP